MAICGANVKTNRIYYVDPNCTNVLRYADASLMLKRLSVTTSGKKFMLMYVLCPAQSQKERCCLHSDDGVLE